MRQTTSAIGNAIQADNHCRPELETSSEKAAGAVPALTRRGLILSADETLVTSEWYHRYGNSPLSEAACYREP